MSDCERFVRDIEAETRPGAIIRACDAHGVNCPVAFPPPSAPASPDLGVEEEARQLAERCMADGSTLSAYKFQQYLLAFGQRMYERGRDEVIAPRYKIVREADEALMRECAELMAASPEGFKHVLVKLQARLHPVEGKGGKA